MTVFQVRNTVVSLPPPLNSSNATIARLLLVAGCRPPKFLKIQCVTTALTILTVHNISLGFF